MTLLQELFSYGIANVANFQGLADSSEVLPALYVSLPLTIYPSIPNPFPLNS